MDTRRAWTGLRWLIAIVIIGNTLAIWGALQLPINLEYRLLTAAGAMWAAQALITRYASPALAKWATRNNEDDR